MRSQRASLVCAALSLVGLGLCAYLMLVHIALMRGDLIGGAVCGGNDSHFNCHAVMSSPLGSFLGVPLALWGLLGYLGTFSLAVIGWQFRELSAKALAALILLALGFIAIDALLLTAMVTKIQYLCRLCLASYAINLLLLLIASWGSAQPLGAVVRQAPQTVGAWLPSPRAPIAFGLWGILLTGAAGVIAVNSATLYVARGAPGMLRKQLLEFMSQRPRVQIDTTGDPMMGAPNGRIHIVEFSDFLCPSCQRAWTFNPILLAGHRQDASFVFKNFPLDKECNTALERSVHPTACKLAEAGECAQEQGKFWELQDVIFKQSPHYQTANLDKDAAALGLNVETFHACLQSGRGLEAVKRDIAEAGRIGVNKTPTYVVNGVVVEGAMSPVMFEEFLRTVLDTH